jgi:hypothetical protein
MVSPFIVLRGVHPFTLAGTLIAAKVMVKAEYSRAKKFSYRQGPQEFGLLLCDITAPII